MRFGTILARHGTNASRVVPSRHCELAKFNRLVREFRELLDEHLTIEREEFDGNAHREHRLRLRAFNDRIREFRQTSKPI